MFTVAAAAGRGRKCCWANVKISFFSKVATEASTSTLSSISTTQPQILRVALVGRPNTGKSTLFNRLTQTKLAIVSNVPGTTRDRNIAPGSICGLDILVTDTGGLDDRGHVQVNVQKQVEYAIASSDVILFLIDAKEGVTSTDLHFANWIRRRLGGSSKPKNNNNNNSISGKEIIVLANKTEGATISDKIYNTVSEALELGLGDPLLVSASHGEGIADLAQALIGIAKEKGFDDATFDSVKKLDKITTEERVIELAVMGRPNVGKSSFVNAVLQEERVIVGPTPGLTRDSVKVQWTLNERRFRLTDTAGLLKIAVNNKLLQDAKERKRVAAVEATGRFDKTLPGVQLMDPEDDPSQFSQQVSELALISALNALRFAQVVLLVVEGTQGEFSKIDLQIARKCLTEGRGLVIAANKSDLVAVSPAQYQANVREHCAALLREMGELHVVPCCAKTGAGVHNVMKAVIATHDAWSKRYSTWILNKWLKELLVAMPVFRSSGRNVTIKYITQVKSRPPVFALFANTISIPGNMERFLRSRLQRDLHLEGVPVRFVVRRTKGNSVKRSLLRRSATKGQTRFNASAVPIGEKRKKNKFLLVKNTREKRKLRRRKDKGRKGLSK